uniref:ZP domain-containing protein n=1 Tax=Ciona savignyi TaxID=51511 RepID=H2YSH2_CIOSA
MLVVGVMLLGLVLGSLTSSQQVNAFLDLPIMNRDANVTCGGLEITVLLRHQYIERNTEWIGNGRFLSLKDRACRATVTQDGDAKFSIAGDFSTCGNTVSVMERITENGALETTGYKFSNRLVHESGTGMVSRRIDLFKFDCIYSANQRLSTMITSADNHVIKIENLNGEMEVIRNISQNEAYETAPLVGSDETVFIRVAVQQPPHINLPTVNFQFTTVIETCWTATTDVKNYTLIQNGYIIKKNYL